MIFGKLWIIANAILYVGIGLIGLISPKYLSEVVGFTLTRPGAYAEIRACYGGLMLALGSYMIYMLYQVSMQQSLLFIFIIYLGFAFGRLVGIITDKAFDSTTLLYISIEVSCIVISYLLFYLAKNNN